MLLRASRIGELTTDELAEVVYDAWLARASKRPRGSGSTSTVSGEITLTRLPQAVAREGLPGPV